MAHIVTIIPTFCTWQNMALVGDCHADCITALNINCDRLCVVRINRVPSRRFDLGQPVTTQFQVIKGDQPIDISREFLAIAFVICQSENGPC